LQLPGAGARGAAMPSFVLLDDARATGAGQARLYRDPVETIVAHARDEVAPALDRLRAALAAGRHAAGFLSYEAGLALEARLAPLGRAATDAPPPLLWFGVFETVEHVDPATVLPDPAGAFVGRPQPRVDRADYDAAVAEALRLIVAGDIYQVNLTFPAHVMVLGDPRAAYARLRAAQEVRCGGLVFTGSHWLLSASPELFFTLEGRAIVARPMKGTLARTHHSDPATLATDAKNRAENLMIVDLIRNDLARVAEAGSVAVPKLFEVESYRTIHHMTSTVTATLAPGRDAVAIIEALFPCGSVTGAPKIRAMEVIDALEPCPRGPYTGSIGWLDPPNGSGCGEASFNVAIRTLVLRDGEPMGTLGLGSAIVADSDAAAEWRECLVKGAFVDRASPEFDLIETMRFDAEEGLAEVERHLARLKASAQALGFAFDRHDARNELQAATFRLRKHARVRLLLARSGRIAIESRPLPAHPPEPVEVALAPLPVTSADWRLAHKTTDRGFYDAARVGAGAFETIFADHDGFLTEGSFTSLFVERDGTFVTPPLSRGLLPGILRAKLIDEGRAHEGDLRAEDLAGGFLIGNALRGLIRARLK